MDNWMKIQMTLMTDELKAEIRKENMELKALFHSLKVEELKAEVTKGNMELRAMITDLINANIKTESSGQKNTQRADTTSDEDKDSQYIMHYQGNIEHEQSEENDSEQDSTDHSDIHEEEAKDDTIEIDDVDIEIEQKQTDGAEMEMLFMEPMYWTPPSKHTISPRENSSPEPILPAKGKPKKSHKLQKLKTKEQSDTPKATGTMSLKAKMFTPSQTPSKPSSSKSKIKSKGHFTDEQTTYIIKYNSNCNPTWSSADLVMQNLKMTGERLSIWIEDEFSIKQLKDKFKNLKRAEDKKERNNVISPKC
ncbi:uncharacterized protein LOC143074246 [Mytilus galloprovincialis]|uniref:Uncharacterized protein n=1 Tax=Mytilus galloprovincialis TaxID=29158 RepID=A0A8B6H130_MYTGA|nr:Hypothetical predicted protein [Mytilus galloprovincialis]